MSCVDDNILIGSRQRHASKQSEQEPGTGQPGLSPAALMQPPGIILPECHCPSQGSQNINRQALSSFPMSLLTLSVFVCSGTGSLKNLLSASDAGRHTSKREEEQHECHGRLVCSQCPWHYKFFSAGLGRTHADTPVSMLQLEVAKKDVACPDQSGMLVTGHNLVMTQQDF